MTHIREAWPLIEKCPLLFKVPIRQSLGSRKPGQFGATSSFALVQVKFNARCSTFRLVALNRGFLRGKSYPTSPQLRRGNHFNRIRWAAAPFMLVTDRMLHDFAFIRRSLALALHDILPPHHSRSSTPSSSTFLHGNSSHQSRPPSKPHPAFCWYLHWSGNPRQYTLPHCDYREEWDRCRRRVPSRRAIRLGLSNCAKKSHEVPMMTERINEKHAPRSSRYKSLQRRNRRVLGRNDHRV